MQVRHRLRHVLGDNAIRHIFRARIPIQRYSASSLGGPLKVLTSADCYEKLRLHELMSPLKMAIRSPLLPPGTKKCIGG